jgi:ribosomal protein L32
MVRKLDEKTKSANDARVANNPQNAGYAENMENNPQNANADQPQKEAKSQPQAFSTKKCFRCGQKKILNGICQNCGERYDNPNKEK